MAELSVLLLNSLLQLYNNCIKYTLYIYIYSVRDFCYVLSVGTLNDHLFGGFFPYKISTS